MPITVEYITSLPLGKGYIGAKKKLRNDDEKAAFAVSLAENTVPLTLTKTADCVDERKTLSLGDGTDDPDILASRIVAQMPGGMVLPVTKAAVAANLAIVRDAKDFIDAYLLMFKFLTNLGFEDGGHQACGASKQLELSIAEDVAASALLQTLPVLTDVTNKTNGLLFKNHTEMHRKLEVGFFGNWTPGWHETHLSEQVPQNFSILADDPNDTLTHGHHSLGVFRLQKPGYGFAKNRFISRTGMEAFCDTTSTAAVLADIIIPAIRGNREERDRFLLELAVDIPQVLNQLVAPGHDVFADVV